MDEKTLNALVNAIKNKDPKGLKAYENLLKIASSKPKNEEEQKNIEAAKGYVAEIKKRLTTKAAHGAKLDYVKSLKHICPEGLELYYFKQGGNLKCGCKGRKMEDGAKVEKAVSGAVARFKEGKRVPNNDSTKIVNSISTITGTKSGFDRAAKEKKEKERKPVTNVATLDKNPGSTKQPMLEALERQHHKNNYKNLLSGGAVAKFKSAKCGSKMKKHKLGGSLNRIPFYLGGTSKGGLKPIVLPEYKMLTGTPTILPGRYTGLEKMTPGLFQMFKTWVKGLPKSLSTSDKVTIGTGTVLGNVLGYDDTHNLNIRKTANKIADKISPLIESSIEYRPFSADKLIESTLKPKNPSFKEFKK